MAGILLSIHPDTLKLNGTSTEEATTLQLNNAGFQPIIWRLRTTAPKRYVVKPSKGLLQPNGTETIRIHLQETVDGNVKDEFRIEYSALQQDDVIGSKCEHVTDVLAGRSKTDKLKRDVLCIVTVPERTAQIVPGRSESITTAREAAAVAPRDSEKSQVSFAQPMSSEPKFGGKLSSQDASTTNAEHKSPTAARPSNSELPPRVPSTPKAIAEVSASSPPPRPSSSASNAAQQPKVTPLPLDRQQSAQHNKIFFMAAVLMVALSALWMYLSQAN